MVITDMTLQAVAPDHIFRLGVFIGFAIYLYFLYWLNFRLGKRFFRSGTPWQKWILGWAVFFLVIGDTLVAGYLIASYALADYALAPVGFWILLAAPLFQVLYYLVLLMFQRKEYTPGKLRFAYHLLVATCLVRVILGFLPQNYWGSANPPAYPENIRLITHLSFACFAAGVLVLFCAHTIKSRRLRDRYFRRGSAAGLLAILAFVIQTLVGDATAYGEAILLPRAACQLASVIFLERGAATKPEEQIPEKSREIPPEEGGAESTRGRGEEIGREQRGGVRKERTKGQVEAHDGTSGQGSARRQETGEPGPKNVFEDFSRRVKRFFKLDREK